MSKQAPRDVYIPKARNDGMVEIMKKNKIKEESCNNLTEIKVFCEKCQMFIRISVKKDEVPLPEQIPFTFTYMHGQKSPAGRHGIVLKLDENWTLLDLTYVGDVEVEEQ